MSKFKTLYEFTIPKLTELTEDVVSENEAGDTVTVSKKITKEVPIQFCIQKPTRNQSKDADLYYNVTVSKGIQAGLMSAALLAKRFDNDGGILSEPEKTENQSKLTEWLEKRVAAELIQSKAEKSPEEEEELASLETRLKELNRDIQDFELRQQNIFNITAETRARNHTLVWWLLNLLHSKDGLNWKPFFLGDTLEDKESFYEDLEDEELHPVTEQDFTKAVITHATEAVALWFYGQAGKHSEFEDAFKRLKDE